MYCITLVYGMGKDNCFCDCSAMYQRLFSAAFKQFANGFWSRSRQTTLLLTRPLKIHDQALTRSSVALSPRYCLHMCTYPTEMDCVSIHVSSFWKCRSVKQLVTLCLLPRETCSYCVLLTSTPLVRTLVKIQKTTCSMN